MNVGGKGEEGDPKGIREANGEERGIDGGACGRVEWARRFAGREYGGQGGDLSVARALAGRCAGKQTRGRGLFSGTLVRSKSPPGEYTDTHTHTHTRTHARTPTRTLSTHAHTNISTYYRLAVFELQLVKVN